MMTGRRGADARAMQGTPEYADFLVNGRLPSDPPALEVSRGERVRLRIVNSSGSSWRSRWRR